MNRLGGLRKTMSIKIMELEKEQLCRIGEIDRSEQIKFKYVYKDGGLQKVEFNFDDPGWNDEQIKQNINMLAPKLEKGGVLLGAFDGDRLVGISALGGEFIGDDLDELQLAFLYVSNGYRRQGIAGRLMDIICERARERGAKRLYISATESESAVGFYLSYGCKLAPKVNKALYALEPHDIHMMKEL